MCYWYYVYDGISSGKVLFLNKRLTHKGWNLYFYLKYLKHPDPDKKIPYQIALDLPPTDLAILSNYSPHKAGKILMKKGLAGAIIPIGVFFAEKFTKWKHRNFPYTKREDDGDY